MKGCEGVEGALRPCVTASGDAVIRRRVGPAGWGVFSKCLSLIHHNDSYAFETGTRFYTPNVKGVNYKFKTDSQ